MHEVIVFPEYDSMALDEESAFYENLMQEYDLATLEALSLGQDFTEIDNTIMQVSLAVFDEATAYYSSDSARLLQLVDTIGSRLEMLGCDHEHFLKAVSERTGASKGHAGADETDAGHGHAAGGKGHHPTRPHKMAIFRQKDGKYPQRMEQVLFDLIARYIMKADKAGNK